jgi:hypothetical protein
VEDVMDCVSAGKKILSVKQEVLKFLLELKNNVNGYKKELDDLLELGDLETQAGKLLKQFNLSLDELRNFLSSGDEYLQIFDVNLSDLREQAKTLSFPFEKSEKASGANALNLSPNAALSFMINCDNDGEFADRMGQFNKKELAALYTGVTGKLGFTFNSKGKENTLECSNSASFNSQTSLYNFFLHPKDISLLEALLADIPRLKYPGMLLDGSKLEEDQYLHIFSKKDVKLNASIDWADTIIRTVNSGSFFTNAITMVAKPELSFDFSYVASSASNILISNCSEGEDWYSVELNFNAKDKKDAAASLGISAGFDGLDKIAVALIKTWSKPLSDLLNLVGQYKEKYKDIEKVLNSYIQSGLDSFVKSSGFQKELKELISDPALAGEVNKIIDSLIKDAKIPEGNKYLDHIQEKAIDPAVELIEKFIKIYQRSLERLFECVKKALKIKLGISFNRKIQTLVDKKAAFKFNINVKEQAEIFEGLINGDFGSAFDAALAGEEGLVLVDGLEEASGLRTISTSLDISFLGKLFSSSTIFSQKWEYRVSSNGDVLISVYGRMQKSYSDWRKKRSSTLLLDSRYMGSSNGSLTTMASFENKMSFELAIDFTDPTPEDILKLQDEMIELKVIKENVDIVSDLKLHPGRSKPFGRLECSAILQFKPAELLKAGISEIIEVFARYRADAIGNHRVENFLKKYGKDVLADRQYKLLLFPELYQWYRENQAVKRDSYESVSFCWVPVPRPNGKDEGFESKDCVTIRGVGPAVHPAVGHVLFFEAFLKAIKDFENETFPGMNREEILAEILLRNKAILGKFSDVQDAHGELDLAVFKTFFHFAKDLGADPCLVVQRKDDKKEFIFN